MTDLAIRTDQPAEVALADYHDAAFDRLARWAESARAAHEVARSLVQTSFVPEAFRGKAHEATAAILSGAEVGLSPMAALRSFDVIQGTAAPRANTLRAVVQSRGHEMVLVESTATRAVVKGRRRGETAWQQSTWTIERAMKMGLTGKHNWKVQPQAMLVARATAECARLVASDAILGIPYAAEELSDEVLDTATTEEVKPPRRTAQRAARPAAVPPPPPEPDFDEPAPADEPAEPITQPQQRKLHALLREHGLADRDAGLARISEILDATVTSTKDLSKADAMRVIDALEDQPPVEEPPLDEWPAVAVPPDAAS